MYKVVKHTSATHGYTEVIHGNTGVTQYTWLQSGYENTRVTHGNPGVTHGDTGVTHGNTGSHLVLQAEVVPRTGKFQALENFACCFVMASDGVR